MKNPYDCSVCDNEDCSGCGESAYESGFKAGIKEVLQEISKAWDMSSDNFYGFGHKVFDLWQAKLKEWGIEL